MTKKEIRQRITEEKLLLTHTDIDYFSTLVTSQLLSSREYEESEVVYLYLAFNQEIKTDSILEKAWKDNKKIAVPRIDTVVESSPESDTATSKKLDKSNISLVSGQNNASLASKENDNRLTKRKKEMNFYYIDSKEELKEGFYGIQEPLSNRLAMDKKALIVMPGLAFDRDFYRIGYGGGYYDHYLMRHSRNNFVKIAFAYDFQILSELIHNEYDVKVDQIITPTLHLRNA